MLFSGRTDVCHNYQKQCLINCTNPETSGFFFESNA